MATLSDIVRDAVVLGLAGQERATVLDAPWCADGQAKRVTYRTASGSLAERVIYEEDAQALTLADNTGWSFTADARDFVLASEARRMKLAHLFDPYLAVHTSVVEPLPHQISAVYEEMLPRIPLRFVLADDPGAGKTVMTGLLVKEMLARGDLKRCLIVCPGSLVEQWQDELREKFGLTFTIMTNETLEASASRNAFSDIDLAIARLDKLARSEEAQAFLRQTAWDLVVVDEAHKMSASMGAKGPNYTKRHRLGQLLGTLTPNLLLLTATPHNGKADEFQLFMSLVDKDQFEGVIRNEGQAIDAAGSMRRLVKEDLLKFDGTPLFPERRAYTVNYTLSELEQGLYDAVTDYVKFEFNRAEKLDGKRRTSVGFALTSLQRRLASSPEAIWRSLDRRHKRLEKRLRELEELGLRLNDFKDAPAWIDDIDEDDWSPEEAEAAEDNLIDSATAAATAEELRVEIATLKRLERQAGAVRISGTDRKWDELSRILQDDARLRDAAGNRLKLIVFTEYKDTLEYLVDKIRSLLGSDRAVVSISGGMGRDARKVAQDRFRQDAEACVLVATDAAGEGVNLQRAHLMVNYDLPWNPNRLEQRFGRIHRIGQTEVCHLWNLVAAQTREGDVYNRLLAKLSEERGALGGKVFDVLGSVTFENRPLRELLVEAIRYGNDPEVRERLHRVVDHAFDPQALKDLIDRYALTQDHMDSARVAQIRSEMDRLAARRLQPYFVGAFFIEAFQRFGGSYVEREPGRYQLKRVPAAFKSAVAANGRVLASYERVCFDRALAQAPGAPQADVLCPGHPLFDAAVEAVYDQLDAVLEEGAILIDEQDDGVEPRLSVSIQDQIVDARGVTVYQGVHSVELTRDAAARDGGPAPYLDYRVPTTQERHLISTFLEGDFNLDCARAESMAQDYALTKLVPAHLQFQRDRRNARINKIEHNVRERLKAEIDYWDRRAWQFKEQVKSGKANAESNHARARNRADELQERKDKRLAELEAERRLSACVPHVTAACLVVPAGLLRRLTGEGPQPNDQAELRRATELAAMEAVMAIERELGNEPIDVSAQKVGYDIESHPPQRPGEPLVPTRFIEVKGRIEGAESINVTCNETVCALNQPANFILAIVEVCPDRTHTTYLRNPAFDVPNGASLSTQYRIDQLKQRSQVVYQAERTR